LTCYFKFFEAANVQKLSETEIVLLSATSFTEVLAPLTTNFIDHVDSGYVTQEGRFLKTSGRLLPTQFSIDKLSTFAPSISG
jgi:hypothetical protein